MTRSGRYVILIALASLMGCRTTSDPIPRCARPHRVVLRVTDSGVTVSPERLSVTGDTDCIEFFIESPPAGPTYRVEQVQFETRPGSGIFTRTIDRPAGCTTPLARACLLTIALPVGVTAYHVVLLDPSLRRQITTAPPKIVIGCPPPMCDDPPDVVVSFVDRR